jgi:hypothetical protein
MRAILALAIFVLGAGSATPEPEYASFATDYFHAAGHGPIRPPVEIESAMARTNRLRVAALQPRSVAVEILRPGIHNPDFTLASASTNIGPDIVETSGDDAESSRTTDVSLDDLCNALFTSAQDNDLPIPFFANLLWQESRLKDDAVSKKGALGIAQFMPETAVETGLDDPFDPLQAIPASARFLRELRLQFGNLGFVAAAYNAGAHRVAEWLEHRGSLPRETRTYVARVTGLSADAWRKIPVDDAALTFVSPLPCRSLPAFASLEQERQEETQLAQAKLEQEQAQAAAAERNAPEPGADRKHARAHARHEARHADRERHAGKHEAEHHPLAAHEKRKNA